MATLDGGRIGIAAQSLGIAEGALAEAINYTKGRVQFGKPISKFQNTQFTFADMELGCEAGRLLTYQAAIAKSYRNPQSDKYFVWQVDYNTSGAFMSWLRLYNGDFVRMLPWTVLMDELTNQWSLEDAVKYILKESYPDLTMEELWNEYKTEVEVFLQNN